MNGTCSVHLIPCITYYSVISRFLYIDVGADDRAIDGGVYGACSLNRAMENNLLNVPPPRCPAGTSEKVPYVILGDEAFPLKTYLIKLYNRGDLNQNELNGYFID